MSNFYAQPVPPQFGPIGLPLGDANVRNAAGGYAYQAPDEMIFRRFLNLGTEGGTYYEGEEDLTKESLVTVKRFCDGSPATALNIAWDVYQNGQAMKQGPFIFVLAYMVNSKDVATRRLIYPFVQRLRTATQLFEFVQTAKVLGRPSSRGWRNAIGNWYASRTPEQLGYQLIKYQQRGGMSHQDILRIAHPKVGESLAPLMQYVMDPTKVDPATLPEQVNAADWLSKDPDNIDAATQFIKMYRLPREALPTQMLKSDKVWEALLESMPMTALIRNLGKISSLGLTEGFSDWTNRIVLQLNSQDALQKARIHPLTLLKALKQYGAGHGDKGSLSWKVAPQIVAALEVAFKLSFVNVEQLDQNIVIAVDCSGSMGGQLDNVNLSASEAAAAMAMVYLASSPNTLILKYEMRCEVSRVNRAMSLREVQSELRPSGGTNEASVFEYVASHYTNVDAVITLTDSMSWAGSHVQPVVDKMRRQQANRRVKCVNVQATVQQTTLFRPEDPLSMEVPGFGPQVPQLINLFLNNQI